MCDKFVSVRRDAVDWLKKHSPTLCEKSGLCEKVAGRLYTRTALTECPAFEALELLVDYVVNGAKGDLMESAIRTAERALAQARHNAGAQREP